MKAPNPLTAAIEESGLVQAILGALEYRGFYDAGKYLDDTILEHITPALEKIHAFGKQEGMEEGRGGLAHELLKLGEAELRDGVDTTEVFKQLVRYITNVAMDAEAARTAHKGDSGKEVHDRAAD